MPKLGTFCWLGWVLVAVPLACGAERFQLTTRSLLIPERGDVTEYVILLDTNQISFMPPPEWRIRLAPAEKKVMLNQPGGSATVSFKFVAEPSGKTPELKREDLRQQIREHFPGDKLVEEFSCYSGSAAGIGFDLERPGNTSRLPVTLRHIFVPIPGQMIELEIAAPKAQFQSLHPALVSLLNSLHCEPLTPTK